MTTVELTAYLDVDLTFSRGESPAFRLDFTGVDAAEVASWVLSAPIRRSSLSEQLDAFDVTVEGTSVTFSLDAESTTVLPDNVGYEVRLQIGESVRIPMGGRLLLRSTVVC